MAILSLSIIFASTYGFFAFSLNGRTIHWRMLRVPHLARGEPWPADTNKQSVDVYLVSDPENPYCIREILYSEETEYLSGKISEYAMTRQTP